MSYGSRRGGRTVAEGEAVDQRHAVEPVVVLGVVHGEEAGPVPQQGAPQPGREGTWRSEVKTISKTNLAHRHVFIISSVKKLIHLFSMRLLIILVL